MRRNLLLLLKKRGVVHAIVCLSILACSCIPFRSIVQHPQTQITDPSDGLLGAWDIWKVQNNLLAGNNVFTGDTFYPHAQSILFSDVFVTSALLSLALRLIIFEPITLYNIILLSSQIATAVTLYMLLLVCMGHEEKQEKEAIRLWRRAVLAGALSLLFVTSNLHLHYVGHLHVFALQYVCLGICSFVKWIEGGKGQWLVGFVVALVLQVWQSFFLAYPMLFLACVSLCFPSVRRYMYSRWQRVIGGGVFLSIGIFPLAVSYLHFFQTYHVVRDIREVIHFSMQIEDIWGKFFSPFLFGMLLLGAVLWCWKRVVLNVPHKLFLCAGIFFFVLCFGPALHWRGESVKAVVAGHTLHVPLPYTAFYFLIPGFQAFRTPSRFFPITVICLLSIVVVILHRRLRLPSVIVLWCMVVGSVLLQPAIASYSLRSVAQYPPAVSYLSRRPERVVALLPLSNWAQVSAREDLLWMLYTLQTNKILLNGQSGFFPDEWMAFQHQVDIASIETKMQLLRDRGVELVVIDTSVVHELPQSSHFAYQLFFDGRYHVYALTEEKLLQ